MNDKIRRLANSNNPDGITIEGLRLPTRAAIVSAATGVK